MLVLSAHLFAQDTCDYSRDFFDQAFVLDAKTVKILDETASSKSLEVSIKGGPKIKIHYQACDHISLTIKSTVSSQQFISQINSIETLQQISALIPASIFKKLRTQPIEKSINFTIFDSIFSEVQISKKILDSHFIHVEFKLFGTP